MDEAIDQRTEKSIIPESRPIREVLQTEFDRRIYELQAFISDLKVIFQNPLDEWFIVPPVMDRTDFGYASDIDFVVLIPPGTDLNDEQVSALTQRYAEKKEVLLIPSLITQEEIKEIETHAPEMFSWYQKQFNKVKPEGEKAKYSGFFEQKDKLEGQLRSSLSLAEKEKLRQERLTIAGEFIKDSRKRVKILKWIVSGSTTGDLENLEFVVI